MCRTKLRKQLRKLIDEFKDRPCADCHKQLSKELMSYDHIRGVKKFNLGGSIAKRSEQEVRSEIAKCEVVCIYCHRKREKNRLLERDQMGRESLNSRDKV